MEGTAHGMVDKKYSTPKLLGSDVADKPFYLTICFASTPAAWLYDNVVYEVEDSLKLTYINAFMCMHGEMCTYTWTPRAPLYANTSISAFFSY